MNLFRSLASAALVLVIALAWSLAADEPGRRKVTAKVPVVTESAVYAIVITPEQAFDSCVSTARDLGMEQVANEFCELVQKRILNDLTHGKRQ